MNEEGLFHAVERRHVWTAVVDQIRELIDSGRLGQGERLPSERQLCAQLGVSRVTVREALRALESVGYVEVRSGSGTYVRRVQSMPSPALRQWLRMHDSLVAKLAELRELVEAELAGTVAGRTGRREALTKLPGTIEELRRHLDNAERYISTLTEERTAQSSPVSSAPAPPSS